MDLDITGIKATTPVQEQNVREKQAEADAVRHARQAEFEAAKQARQTRVANERIQDEPNVEQYLREILNYTEFFNKRLRFSINRELDQVIVKVIDSQTDKVIKEIPPEVLQRLHVRIREAIGLLIDEVI